MSFLPAEDFTLLLAEQMPGTKTLVEGPIWIRPRAAGRARPGFWFELPQLDAAVSAALKAAEGCDTIEINLTRNYQPVPINELNKAFPNAQMGLRGIEISLGHTMQRIAPITSITQNRNPLAEIERFARQTGETLETLLTHGRIRRFDADQFLLKLTPEPRCIPLYRGGRVVDPADIGPKMLQATVKGMSDWMFHHVAENGQMTYKYWPSRGRSSTGDNTIRQFMATVALGRLAKRSQDPAEADAARRNLSHNLQTYFDDSTGFGTIIYDGKAKLGAMALAALAILEFRAAGIIPKTEHDYPYRALQAGIDHLWQEDGAFRTFLVPADRNDNQNFYPGEALLFWASLYRETRDPGLAARAMQSFRYYRDWHLGDPNPAFVPWHVQAYCMFYEDLGHSELADFVFDRSSWLLGMQQWGERLAPDFQGRFYDPKRPHFGPPHASATGVYMEGLIAAWRLARQLNRSDLAAEYAKSLKRGLRALRQLQYRDRDSCAFYLSRPEAAMGGLRTESYNNEIRVDNVQHGLMALLHIEGEADFPWNA